MTVFARNSISMRIYPHNELPADQIVTTFLSQAKGAERVGFDGIMTAEHHGGFGGYLPNPLQFAGWALEATNLKWAAASPLLLPLRPNALVIEEVAWMAARFPGRVGLGVGAGSLELDFQIMDQEKEGFIQRFLAGLPIVARALSGGDAGLLKDDPAIMRTKQHPIPVMSAAGTAGGTRAAAHAGAGLILGGGTTMKRARELVDIYRDNGGKGPIMLICRAWVGDRSAIKDSQSKQLDLYKSYAPKGAMDHWVPDPIMDGSAKELAEKLASYKEQSGAEMLNIRVHVPGATPDQIRGQIDQLAEVLQILRKIQK